MDPRPVLPIVTIEKTGGGVYTFDPFVPTTDYQIIDLRFKPPQDLEGGTFIMTLTGATAATSEVATIDSNIDEGNEVTIWIGKTDALKTKIFLGIIETIEIIEHTVDYAVIKITGPDWGSDILDNRIIWGGRIQKKLTNDQTQLDPDDDEVLASNIVISMLSDTEWYPDNIYPIPVTEQGIIVDPANVSPDDVHISQIEANYETLGDKLKEIDDITVSRHFVDPDKKFFMRPKNSVYDSGLLFVSDDTDSLATSWNSTKVGHILPDASHQRTVENHKRRLFGIGSNLVNIDQNSQVVTNTVPLPEWYAQRFTPTFGDCYNIGLYLSGDPSVDTTIFLEEDKAGKPGGKVLRSLSLNQHVVSSSGGWIYFPIGEKLTVGDNYWIVIANADNLFWHRDDADSGANTLATSPDGVAWSLAASPVRYTLAFIHYVSSELTVITPTGLDGTAKHLHEEVIHRPDINEKDKMNKYINGTYSLLQKSKELLTLKVRSSDIIPKTGDLVRIKKNTTAKPIGASSAAFFTVTGIEYAFQASDIDQVGTYNFELTLSRMLNYA